MRRGALLCACLAVVATAHRAQAGSGPDGFAICTGDLENCAPLTNQAMQSYRLTAEEAGTVATLKRYATIPADALIEALAKSFAEPYQLFATPGHSTYWFQPRRGTGCFACGVRLTYSDEKLDQMNYTVEGKFTIIWNRVAVVNKAL